MTTVFTSLTPHRHGITNRFAIFEGTRRELASLRSDLVTFPEVLHAAGFATAAFTGDAGLDGVHGFARGFDVYYDSVPFAGFSSTVPRALDWLSRRGAQPFFMFLHGYDAHGQGPWPPAQPDRSGRFQELRRATISGHNLDVPEDERRAWRAVYDSRAAHADEGVGRFLDALAAMPELSSRTAVIIMADHGEELFERGGVDHGTTLYDEVLRVPLLVRVPGRKPRRVAAQVRLLDVAPTILDLLGVKDPRFKAQAQGVSLRPLLDGGELPPMDALSETDFLYSVSKRSVRLAGGRKLIFDLENLTRECYDLRRDPGERADLCAKDAAAGRETDRRLRSLLDLPQEK
jgi:arylsulfatase A-like enzyme